MQFVTLKTIERKEIGEGLFLVPKRKLLCQWLQSLTGEMQPYRPAFAKGRRPTCESLSAIKR
jgi:hypothetical protein